MIAQVLSIGSVAANASGVTAIPIPSGIRSLGVKVVGYYTAAPTSGFTVALYVSPSGAPYTGSKQPVPVVAVAASGQCDFILRYGDNPYGADPDPANYLVQVNNKDTNTLYFTILSENEFNLGQ